MVGSGLRPLRRVAAEVQRRDVHSLTPIGDGAAAARSRAAGRRAQSIAAAPACGLSGAARLRRGCGARAALAVDRGAPAAAAPRPRARRGGARARRAPISAPPSSARFTWSSSCSPWRAASRARRPAHGRGSRSSRRPRTASRMRMRSRWRGASTSRSRPSPRHGAGRSRGAAHPGAQPRRQRGALHARGGQVRVRTRDRRRRAPSSRSPIRVPAFRARARAGVRPLLSALAMLPKAAAAWASPSSRPSPIGTARRSASTRPRRAASRSAWPSRFPRAARLRFA